MSRAAANSFLRLVLTRSLAIVFTVAGCAGASPPPSPAPAAASRISPAPEAPAPAEPPPRPTTEQEELEDALVEWLAANTPGSETLRQQLEELRRDPTDSDLCVLRAAATTVMMRPDVVESMGDLGRRMEAHPGALPRARERYAAQRRERESIVRKLFEKTIDCAAVKVADLRAKQAARDKILSWFTRDERAARAEAKRTKRGILLFFYASSCTACDAILDTPFSSDTTRVSIEHSFVPVLIDLGDDASPAAVAAKSRYQVIGPPAIVAFDAAGKERARFGQLVTIEALRAGLAPPRGPMDPPDVELPRDWNW